VGQRLIGQDRGTVQAIGVFLARMGRLFVDVAQVEFDKFDRKGVGGCQR
jgi:hypothetical protein